MVICAVLVVAGMTLEVGLGLEGKGIMGEGSVDLGDTALEMGVENVALKEGGLLEGGVTGLSMEVVQVLLYILPTSSFCVEKSASGMGRHHSPCHWRPECLSIPPMSHLV